jgi:hypothetical protein
MRNKVFTRPRLFLCCLSLAGIPLVMYSQVDSATKSARESLVYLQYFVKNNQVPYLKVQTKNKSDKGFQPAQKVPVSIYLDKDSLKEALVADVITDTLGESIVGLPPSLASLWKESDAHTFIANAASATDFDATVKTVGVTIARLELDTVNNENGRSVVARLLKKEGSSWIPVPDVDLRLTVKRLGGYLNIGDKESYTTDSTGKAEGEFLHKNLPGDSLGNIELIALLDDNDEVGSLQTGMRAPWGTPLHSESNFGERSLWATGTRAPFWLIVLATGCIVSVWSVIIYLFTRIYQIRKLSIKEK